MNRRAKARRQTNIVVILFAMMLGTWMGCVVADVIEWLSEGGW